MIQPRKPHANTFVVRERYRLCPQCGNFSHFSERHAYCILCGVKLLESCPGCREPILYPTAKFCPACGEALLQAAQPVKPDVQVP